MPRCPAQDYADRDAAIELWCDGMSGLPGHLTRMLSALGVYHLLVDPRQPWWHGVVERFLRTCRQEVILPAAEDGAAVPQAVETARHFYNEQRCHSQCQDQPPATVHQASTRHLLADFDPAQAPFTHEPWVVSRQMQASGRISLAGHIFPFSSRYAHQTITVTVTGWSAVGQAADGWQRT